MTRKVISLPHFTLSRLPSFLYLDTREFPNFQGIIHALHYPKPATHSYKTDFYFGALLWLHLGTKHSYLFSIKSQHTDSDLFLYASLDTSLLVMRKASHDDFLYM